MTIRAAALGLVLLVPCWGGSAAAPRWASFDGIAVGGSQDDVMALNGSCRTPRELDALSPESHPEALVDFAFGFSLPHRHSDTTGIMRALGTAALCRVSLPDVKLLAMVVTIDRIVVGATIVPQRDSLPPGVDSIRRVLRRAWGPPTAPAPTLDSWLGSRYRGYLAVTPVRGQQSGIPEYRIILVDVSACSAFDRRLHRLSHRGTAEPC
ncbi:MAG TPA: hypothetical protein VI160_02175 [Gemmatimonadales bacterium]